MKQKKTRMSKINNDYEKIAKVDGERFPIPSLQWNDIFKVVGSIAGFVGLGGALLWLFGRSYYAGIFSSFGLSSLTTSIAPEDYLERGSINLVYLIMDVLFTIFLYYLAYLSKILYYERVIRYIPNRLLRTVSILIVFTVSVIASFFLISTSKLGISARFFYEDTINFPGVYLIFLAFEVTFLFAPPAGINDQNKQSKDQSLISSKTPIAIARILILVVILSEFIVIQSRSSFVTGQLVGCLTTLRKSTPAAIFSTHPILIDGQTRTKGLYTYDGYFLLFTDRDNYYLFREINTVNYKPQSFFVVSKSVADTIQISRNQVSEDDNKRYVEMCIKNIQNS